jgi:hypothetical protein
MKTAVIGWGSLIWDPQDLQIVDDWYTDGPMLPVEFARVSSRNRLTLVLLDGAPLQQTLWTLSRKATLTEAIRDLAIREGTVAPHIGRWSSSDTHVGSEDRISAIIDLWARERELDAVVWTALGPKKPNGENGLAAEDDLIEYLRNLDKRGEAAAAREYVEKAPSQIKTPLRVRIQREIGWHLFSNCLPAESA